MQAFATFPTLIPALQVEWNASNTEMGWVAGVYFAAYVIAVAFLVSITDRTDARNVYLGSLAVSMLATLAFAFYTTGPATASIWRCLQGIGLAGTYMPGLKALVDAVPQRMQSRTIAVYTACFGVGVAFSFLTAGYFTQVASWNVAFLLASIGPFAALGIALIALPSVPPRHELDKKWLPDFRSVLRNRVAVGFSLAYSAHNVELFAFRSWAVALLYFAMTSRGGGEFGAGWNAAVIVAAVSLLSQPFSVITNEFAERLGRIRVIAFIMTASAACGIALGYSTSWHMLAVVFLTGAYAVLCMSDSASITAAVIQSARPSLRGTTMAFHSLVGFAGAFVGPVLFGAALDLAGGESSAAAWATAFIALAIAVCFGTAAMLLLTRGRS